MQHFKILLSLMVALLTLSSCGKTPISIPDFVVTGWLGPVGGPSDACSSVHTNSTNIKPVHHTLDECFEILNGSIIIKGADFNTIVEGRDKLCVEEGSCTYEQAQAAARLRKALSQISKVNPARKKP